jgi:hypothetical protein
VSVKYQCPGEEMDPGALITVADDDDLAVRFLGHQGRVVAAAVERARLWRCCVRQLTREMRQA